MIFAIVFFAFSLVYSTSFGLTESVDLFGLTSSVDLVLNDIWIEPENPKNGESVSVHASLYNAGVIPLADVSDAITIGYIVNGDLVKIDLLENILPGTENGIEISSGPIFDAVSGNYVVTAIVNYHDTLSHLRDNPENNIVQKTFKILDGIPLLIQYDIYQKYDDKTNKQQVTVKGKLTDIFQGKLNNQKIILDIGDVKSAVTTDINGEFLFITSIPFHDEPIKVSAQIKNDISFPVSPQMILPLKMNHEQSALVVHTTSLTNDFENSALVLVVFQDSYDNMFKKISPDNFDDQSMRIGDSFLTILPANHEYIVEVYLDGRFLDAFQNDFTENIIIQKELTIPEPAMVQFRVINEVGESQNNVVVNNWIYSAITDEDGFTDWIEVLPTVIVNEPYAAKATFPNSHVFWSDSFLIESGERKIVEIIQRSDLE